MKYFIAIDNSDKNHNNNFLFYENNIDTALDYYTTKYKLTSNDKEELKKAILTYQETPNDVYSKYHLQFIVDDDENLCVPYYHNIFIAIKDNDERRWFGNYASYVLGLWVDDLGVDHRYEIKDVEEYVFSRPSISIDAKEQTLLTNVHFDFYGISKVFECA